MLKQQHIDISSTNLALFGSALEREIKKAAAEHEEQWRGLAGNVGLHIWRIEKFHVVPWPKEHYGEFYRGDSYIVLHCYKAGDQYKYDVHFWLGSSTTADEAGTACYKTVELDTLLDDLPVQHREVEGYESETFHSYFPNGIHLLEGGIESGFRHVEPEAYQPRLLHVKGTYKSITCSQMAITFQSLNSGDVFILDGGLKIFQWNGSKSNGAERMKATQLSHAINDDRKGLPHVFVLNEGDEEAEFWELLGGQGPIKTAEEGGSDNVAQAHETVLLKLSDASGALNFTEIARGNRLNRNLLNSDDAFILDHGSTVFAWIGKGASPNEKKLAIQYAHDYIISTGLAPYTHITRIIEGSHNQEWESAFAA